MNGWLGRILGLVVGFLVAGPGGALIGLLLGNIFDRATRPRAYYSEEEQKHIQDTYFRVTFQVLGHVAKSDGRVSENEIRAAKNIMDRMHLNNTQRKAAIFYFEEGKSPYFDLKNTLDELATTCHRQRVLLQMFVEIQFNAAKVDGLEEANKVRILEVICQRLGFRPIFHYQNGQQSSQQHTRDKKHYSHSKKSSRDLPPLQSDYQLLECSANASVAEIKSAYRRQMSRNHPDKLISQGLPEEMIKIATNKTQQIRAAYDRIRKKRGF